MQESVHKNNQNSIAHLSQIWHNELGTIPMKIRKLPNTIWLIILFMPKQILNLITESLHTM